MVIGRHALVPGVVLPSRPIGALIMEDESGQDEKILAVPVNKLHPFYEDVTSYKDLHHILIEQIEHFFTHYKDLEKGKWVKVKQWVGPEGAGELILEGMERYKTGK
jgi:inorganic pyrophosphatase